MYALTYHHTMHANLLNAKYDSCSTITTCIYAYNHMSMLKAWYDVMLPPTVRSDGKTRMQVAADRRGVVATIRGTGPGDRREHAAARRRRRRPRLTCSVCITCRAIRQRSGRVLRIGRAETECRQQQHQQRCCCHRMVILNPCYCHS